MIESRKLILWAAFIVALLTYSFWSLIGNGAFYIGNSLFILLLCTFLFKKYGKSVICFLLLAVSLNNFLDELFFNPTEIQFNEMFLLIATPIIWYLKQKKYARKNTK